MKTKIKRPLIFVMALLPIAVIGGLSTGIYIYESCSKEIFLITFATHAMSKMKGLLRKIG